MERAYELLSVSMINIKDDSSVGKDSIGGGAFFPMLVVETFELEGTVKSLNVDSDRIFYDRVRSNYCKQR
jgi:hypothetical protein